MRVPLLFDTRIYSTVGSIGMSRCQMVQEEEGGWMTRRQARRCLDEARGCGVRRGPGGIIRLTTCVSC